MLLLVADGKLALRLLVVLGKALQLHHRLALVDGDQELDVRLGVLVAGEDLGVVGQRRQRLVQRRVHLGRVTLEELAAAADEERVAGEDRALVRRLVLHEVADAVLRVARRVQRRHADVLADAERFPVLGRAADARAVFAADDGDLGREGREHLLVPARMVPVVVRVYDGGQVDLAIHALFQRRQNFVRVGGVDYDGVFGGFVGHQVGVVVGRANPLMLSA